MLQAFEKVHKACPEIDGAALGAGQIGFAHVNAVTVTFYRLAHNGFRGMDSTTIQGLIHNGGHPGLYPKLNAAQTRVDIPFQLTHCHKRTTTQKHQKCAFLRKSATPKNSNCIYTGEFLTLSMATLSLSLLFFSRHCLCGFNCETLRSWHNFRETGGRARRRDIRGKEERGRGGGR